MVCHPRQPCRRDEEAEILHALHKIEHLLGIETMRLGIDDVRTLHQMRQAMLAAAVGQRGPRVDRDPSGLVMLFSRSAAATCPTDLRCERAALLVVRSSHLCGRSKRVHQWRLLLMVLGRAAPMTQ